MEQPTEDQVAEALRVLSAKYGLSEYLINWRLAQLSKDDVTRLIEEGRGRSKKLREEREARKQKEIDDYYKEYFNRGK